MRPDDGSGSAPLRRDPPDRAGLDGDGTAADACASNDITTANVNTPGANAGNHRAPCGAGLFRTGRFRINRICAPIRGDDNRDHIRPGDDPVLQFERNGLCTTGADAPTDPTETGAGADAVTASAITGPGASACARTRARSTARAKTGAATGKTRPPGCAGGAHPHPGGNLY